MPQLHRLQNDKLGRLLHDVVYQRIINFCTEYTPEIPAQVIADTWMQRVYNNDNNLHIILDLDGQYNVLGHAVIDLQDHFGYKVVHCYQVQGDKKGSMLETAFGMEYLDKLAASVGAYYTIFYVKKNIKALEKYGYKAARTAMLKSHITEQAMESH